MNDYPILTAAQKKSVQKLLQKKYREENRRFFIEGPHLVQEALKSHWTVDELLITPSFLENTHAPGILRDAGKKKIKIYQCSDAVLEKIGDAVTTQGILAVVVEFPRDIGELWRQKKRESLIVALDGITDPGNLGTIIRSCDWFGVDAVLLGRGTVELFNPKTLRSTMGSVFHLPVVPGVNLVEELSAAIKCGYTILAATSGGGTSPEKSMFSKKSVIIFGNEAHGVQPSLLARAEHRVTIPRFGEAESLNVGISCGIILSWFRLSPTLMH